MTLCAKRLAQSVFRLVIWIFIFSVKRGDLCMVVKHS